MMACRTGSHISRGFILIVICWLSMWSAPVLAVSSCGLNLRFLATYISITDSIPTVTLPIAIGRTSATQACNYAVTFSKGLAASYQRQGSSNADRINYNLFGSASMSALPLKDKPDITTPNEVISGQLAVGVLQANASLQIRGETIDSGNIRHVGTYTDTIVAHVYAGDPLALPTDADDQVTFQVAYTVRPMCFIGLVSPGGNFTLPATTLKNIDFGILQAGQTQSFEIAMVYNAGYSVSLQSTNMQNLRHSTLYSLVPYKIKVRGAEVNLTSGGPVEVARGYGVSSSAPVGDRMTVQVIIGDPKGAASGSYSDRIQVTMTTTE